MTDKSPAPKLVPIRPASRALARFRWMAAVLADPRYTPGDKCALIRLALHQNVETGRLFVSADRLGQGANLFERQVQRTIAKAGRLGSITANTRRGRGRANFYNLKNTTPESYFPDKYDSGVRETPPKIRLPSRPNREDITGDEIRPTMTELKARHPDLLKRIPDGMAQSGDRDGASGKADDPL
jgi:hypothetical protein